MAMATLPPGLLLRFLKYDRDRTGEWRHPRELDGAENGLFLTHLAGEKTVAAARKNQALGALVFLHREVLRVEAEGSSRGAPW